MKSTVSTRAHGFGSRAAICLVAALAACNGPDDDGGSPDTGDTEPPPSDLPAVAVNEVMAMNETTWADELGAYPDWIELWNSGDTAADLSGWWLSDDADDPFKWQFPDGVTVDAGGYVVVFCDNDEEEGNLHASFRLDGLGGEDVALFGPNVLDNPLVDVLDDMGIQLPDISYARMPDGGPTWQTDDSPTPQAANN